MHLKSLTWTLSLQVIESLSSSKPKQFVKTGLVRKVVLALCAMCAEPDPEDYEEDSDDLPSNKVASQVRVPISVQGCYGWCMGGV